MNRDLYIDKLLAIYKLKYKPTEVEIEEFKLLLEMMPDKPIINPPKIGELDWPLVTPSPRPFDTIPLAYGPPYPDTLTAISHNEEGK